MDEEDISEAGIAPKIVTARAEFSGIGKKAPAPTKRGDWMGSLDDVVVSSSNTIGAKLLRIMGWKDGQGVGQRIDSRMLSRLKAKERVRAAETGRVPVVWSSAIMFPRLMLNDTQLMTRVLSRTTVTAMMKPGLRLVTHSPLETSRSRSLRPRTTCMD